MKRSSLLLATLFFSAFACAAPTHRGFVTNEKGNSLSVFDTRTNEVVATVDVGQQPRGIGMAPDGSEIYVALGKADAIAVIDPNSLKVLRTIESGSDPEAFAVHPNGNLYISNEEDAKASVTNPKTGKVIAEIPVGIEPEGVAISPDGTRVIVTSESTNMLHVISVPEHELVANILVGARPRAAVFNKAGNLAYASAEIGGQILKVDMQKNAIITTGALNDDKAKPKDLTLSADETLLYVAGGRANGVFVLDANTLEIKQRIDTGVRVWGLAMNHDRSRLYATNGVSNTVSVIDTAKNAVIANIAVGEAPWGVIVDD